MVEGRECDYAQEAAVCAVCVVRACVMWCVCMYVCSTCVGEKEAGKECSDADQEKCRRRVRGLDRTKMVESLEVVPFLVLSCPSVRFRVSSRRVWVRPVLKWL
jgi:hypothetical protein